MAETICNTSPLQYLFQVDLLDLLPLLYREVIVPEAVLLEIADGRHQGVALPDVESLPWAQVARVGEEVPDGAEVA
jgi:predicted nucleic acid-binding protein